MLARTLLVALLVGACATPVPVPESGPVPKPGSGALLVPCTIVGDGEHGVLLGNQVVTCLGAAVSARAADADQWSSLCRQFGGELAAMAHDAIDFANEQRVLVALPASAALIGIVVSSEEGVDVLTLDVDQAATGDQRSRACLLRLSRRSCQMALVVRDQRLGEEHTVAVLPGLM